MKFLLPLLALIPFAMGQQPFFLTDSVLGMDDSTKPIFKVSYANSRKDPPSGSDAIVMGATVQGYASSCVGQYDSGAVIGGLSLPGITDDYSNPGSVTQVGGSFQTEFTVTVDPSEIPASIYTGDETAAATIKFCLIIGLDAVGGPLVDFTETEITITFNLIDNTIESFMFNAVTESASNFDPIPIAIDTITQACVGPDSSPASIGGALAEQGEQVCFEVCVNQANTIGAQEDWRVSSLFDVQVSGLVGSADIIQPIDGDNQLVTWWAQVGNCFKVIFYPNAAYFNYGGNIVTINGGAKMSRLSSARRLRSVDHRALAGYETAEGEFEMEVELEGQDGDSAAITIKQITFAAGVAGVALLV